MQPNSNVQATNNVYIRSNPGTGGVAILDGGSVELYHLSDKRLYTDAAGITVGGIATATGFSTSGGTSSQFLKADGSVDGSTYLTSESQTLDDVLALGATTARDISTTGTILYANVFATIGALPNATTYHGMFAHVHSEGH